MTFFGSDICPFLSNYVCFFPCIISCQLIDNHTCCPGEKRLMKICLNKIMILFKERRNLLMFYDYVPMVLVSISFWTIHFKITSKYFFLPWVDRKPPCAAMRWPFLLLGSMVWVGVKDISSFREIRKSQQVRLLLTNFF